MSPEEAKAENLKLEHLERINYKLTRIMILGILTVLLLGYIAASIHNAQTAFERATELRTR